MEVERCQHLNFAILVAAVGVLIASGHRPASQHGDEIAASLAWLPGEEPIKGGGYASFIETTGDCTQMEKPRCCEKLAEDKPSTVGGCSCLCKADPLTVLMKSIDDELAVYKSQGFPVEKVKHPNHPNYTVIDGHILANKFKTYAGKPGKLHGLKDQDKPQGDQPVEEIYFANWKKKFYSAAVDGVKGDGDQKNRKDALTVESDAAKDELFTSSSQKSFLKLDEREPKWKLGLPDPTLKGDWYKAIINLADDAFKIRMMAEEELFALRDFSLKACATCNKKVKEAAKELEARKAPREAVAIEDAPRRGDEED